MKDWTDLLEQTYPLMVEWRRHLHRHPELSYRESATAAFVAGHLRNWGLDVRTDVGGHGIVARLRGEAGGPVVALRADMDALPIQDEKLCEYASQVPGVMHACGHDAHTAVLLGVARILSFSAAKLPGDVLFLFQPAEETTPGGALPMIGEGALQEADAIYGIHLWTPFPVGTASSRPGAMMAAADEFVIEVKGRGGHGGLPHETVDSIYIASQLVVNLQSIVSRNTDPTECCVVSVGTFQAGAGFNAIAERALLKGTVRTFDESLRHAVKDRIQRIAEQTCLMHGAEAVIEYKLGYPPVVNDKTEIDRFFRAAANVMGDTAVSVSPPIMAAEDFAYYLQNVPGCFMFVGAGNAEKGIVYPHHHPKFDVDESSMRHAARLFLAMVKDRMDA